MIEEREASKQKEVSSEAKVYTVEKGDTLVKISQKTGIPLKKLLEMNPHLRGRENYIEVGEGINLDPETIPDWAKREATTEEKLVSRLIGLKWEMKQRQVAERREEWDAKAVTIPLTGWGVRPSNWIYGTPETQRLAGINRFLQKEVMPIAFDTGVGFIPVAGEVNDAIDTTLAATTGKDKWGKVVPKWMIPVMVVACLLPVVSTGLVKLAGKATVKATTEVVETVGEKGKYVRDVLPPLEEKYAEAFENIQIRTFKKGKMFYRSPSDVDMNEPWKPGNWLGTREAKTREGVDSLYYLKEWKNPLVVLRKYELVEDATFYYGKVKNGKGYQIYVPEDIDTSKIFKLIKEVELK
ncbi:MAG: LysM peptidoglycan-binding domain-containing protein [Brevinematales bacterium]|nr:LysM peptidoglycan-binding domain-containing protein [Brevinematales bacterium]